MRASSRLFLVLWLLACSPQVVNRNAVSAPPAVSAPSQWEPDIARFEAEDRANPPRLGSIVFVGSSSIRMWTTLERDFAGVPVLNRGFGGSEAGDVAQFAERIVIPYKPPVVVLYAGDNDLAAGKTPAEVLSAFQSFVAIMHAELPGTRVVFVSIKPSIARWGIVDKMRAANQLVRDYTRTEQTRLRRRVHSHARPVRSAEARVVSRGWLAHDPGGICNLARPDRAGDSVMRKREAS